MVDGRTGSEKARSTFIFLRRKIVSGEWPINSAIPKETELMELIGVGKSTVREAVRSLASLGMLETIRGVGTFVRSQTPISRVITDFLADYGLEQILIYRRALEIEAAQLAAVNRTEENLAALRASLVRDTQIEPDGPRTIERGTTPGPFHHLIFEAANSPLLAAMYSGVMAAVRTAMRGGQIVYGASHDLRYRDHGALLDAIESQDITKAAHAMALHVDRDLVADDTELNPLRPTARLAVLLSMGAGATAD